MRSHPRCSRNSPRSTPPNYRSCRRACGSALAWAGSESSSVSGSTFPTTRPSPTCRFPRSPWCSAKWTSAIVGPNDDIEIPRGAQKTDWEVELGVVIGRHGRYIPESEALSHVAGYCVIHDVSEREFQLERGGTWDKGKGCDTFGPLGPWLVTKDEITDPHALAMWLEVDGKRYQNGNSANMIFRIPKLISYLSGMMSLHPGDVISTGTPAGVGLGQRPPVYPAPGQFGAAGHRRVGRAATTGPRVFPGSKGVGSRSLGLGDYWRLTIGSPLAWRLDQPVIDLAARLSSAKAPGAIGTHQARNPERRPVGQPRHHHQIAAGPPGVSAVFDRGVCSPWGSSAIGDWKCYCSLSGGDELITTSH